MRFATCDFRSSSLQRPLDQHRCRTHRFQCIHTHDPLRELSGCVPRRKIYFVDADCCARMSRMRIVAEHAGTIVRQHEFENYPAGTTPHTTAPLEYLIFALATSVSLVRRIAFVLEICPRKCRLCLIERFLQTRRNRKTILPVCRQSERVPCAVYFSSEMA